MLNSVNPLTNTVTTTAQKRPESRKTAADPAELSEDEKTIKARLNNPDLSAMDRIKIFSYMRVLALRDRAEKTDRLKLMKEQIKKRLIELGSESMANYTGREDMSKLAKNYNAFNYVVEALNMFNEKEWSEINDAISGPYLSAEDKRLIESKNKEEVLNKIYNYSYSWQGNIWGTKTRADLYRTMTAFEGYARKSGVNETNQYLVQGLYNGLFENLEEANLFMQADNSIDTPEKTDDERLQPYFINNYKYRALEFYFGLKMDDPKLDDLMLWAQRYSNYRNYANKIGISREVLDAVDNTIKDQLKGMKGMSNGPTKVLAPSELPEDVIALLKRTEYENGCSYYQYLMENVEYIIMSSEKREDPAINALIGVAAAGEQVADGAIYVNILDKDPRLPDDINIFATIIHECSHASDEKKYFEKEPEKLRSTATECAAYSHEAQALGKLKENLKLPQDVRSAIAKTISQDEAMAKSASFILNTSPANDDLDVYPSNTPFFKAYNYALYLCQHGYIGSDETDYYEGVISDLFLDKFKIEDMPVKARYLIKELLENIDVSFKGLNYDKAMGNYISMLQIACPDKKIYGQDIIENLLSYSADHKLRAANGRTINVLDDKGKKVDVLSGGTKVKALIAPSITMEKEEYSKIKYGNREGYVLSSCLVEDAQ